MDSLLGRTLSHYRIKSLLGQGGMGAVYRAEDTQLGRDVALKVLPPEVAGDPERLRRFQIEARAVAALNHPAIVTIHSVEEAEGIHFLTLELVEGESLSRRIPPGGMTLEAFFAVAVPLTRALAAAHARGIVHRDVKPANVMVSDAGETKVLDFGLARVDAAVPEMTAPTQTATQVGTVVGTPGYMSPEQARGLQVDVRSDVFSAGVVMHEMLTGQQPFRRADGPSTIHAILHDDPGSAQTLRDGLPGGLSLLIDRCLEKSPAARFESGAELSEAVGACSARAAKKGASSRLMPVLAVSALALLLAFGSWWALRERRARRINAETIPRIEAFLDDGNNFAAFTLAGEALASVPGDSMLQSLYGRSSLPVNVTTQPPGASVTYREYRDPDGPWFPLGTAPIEQALIPSVYLAVRAELPGYEPALRAFGGFSLDIELLPEGTAPSSMVPVPEGSVAMGTAEPTILPAFLIDRYEVANVDFQGFVDAGGYAKPEYWPESLPEGALSTFVDATGRPGPAGWELGRYPEGRDRHPVGGVSWFEAMAYARWAGKSLPSVYHWLRAAGTDYFSDILTLSNFDGRGPAPVGQYRGLGRFGTYDMAGNVKEWCLNPTGAQRYTLGGGWDESSYLFLEVDARAPLDRHENLGFRLMQSDTPLPPGLDGNVGETRFDFGGVQPVSDEVYGFFAGLYDYSPRDLDARTERVDDSARDWRYEAVSVQPAYSGPRLTIHLFLPRNTTAPYQAVIDRPNSSINFLTHIQDYSSLPDFIPRAGRVLAIPAYWGTLDRRTDSSDFREKVLRQVQDFRRTIDYLETRDDIDTTRLAYSGMSAGGEYAPLYLAVEPRVRAAVLVGAGFHDAHMLAEPPEINPWNFSPRVAIPTLILNGENDFTLPRQTAQQPFFDLLGTDPAHKRLVTISGGHVTSDRHTQIRETLDWLDRYLGPVKLTPR